MRHLLSELVSTWAAFVALGALLVGSGAPFARLLRFPGFAEAGLAGRAGKALLVAFAALPVLLDLAGRLGPGPMTAFGWACALAGWPVLLRGLPPRAPPDWRLVLAAALWLVVGALWLADWPDEAGFVRSMLSLDHVKHAAASWSVAESGTPPWNPSFYEPGRKAAYYYFFYTLTGAASYAGAWAGLAARHFAYASSLLAPFALYALAETLAALSRADEAAGGRARRSFWAVALIAATGLDIVPVLLLQNLIGYYPPDPEWWNEQVASWAETFLWTPHHLASLCAAWVGFVALADPRGKPGWRGPALAALAFASMAGQSVYVAMGAAATAAVWMVWLAIRARWRDVARLAAAGTGALALAAPWLATLAAQIGAGERGGPPLALSLRTAPWHWIACGDGPACVALGVAQIPVFYLVELGVFALGAFVFWRRAGRAGLANDVARLLSLSAIVALVLGAFVRSTVLYNDFGWRVVLFAQLATLVWTLAAARNGAFDAPPLRTTALAALALGYAMVATEFFQMRREPEQSALQRATLADEIPAWAWLGARLPHGAVAQERPRMDRAFSYGLLGRNPAYVSDRMNARLFGATEAGVALRMAEISPLFERGAPDYAGVRATAERAGVSALVVTALDPVFADPDGWAANAKPAWANARVKIFLFGDAAR